MVIHSRGNQPEWFGGIERNAALDLIPVDDSLVWNLDDDNLVHPSMGTALAIAVRSAPDASGYLFGQRRSDGAYLPPKINAVIGEVDTAQFVFRRDAIGSIRWKKGHVSDGEFFAEIRDTVGPHRIVSFPVTACFHNALRL